jgi:hypothetical protein
MKFEETRDRIVLTQSKLYRLLFYLHWGILVLMCSFGLLYLFFLLLATPENFWALLMFIFGGIFFINAILFDTITTVDRTFKRIILKKDSFLKPLRSFKEIPFSDIKKFG